MASIVFQNGFNDASFLCTVPSGLAYCSENNSIRDTVNKVEGASSVRFTSIPSWINYINSGVSFFPSGMNQGSISLYARPGYSGSPPFSRTFIAVSNDFNCINQNLENSVHFQHTNAGNVDCFLRDKDGSLISTLSGAWSPTIDTWYHFLLAWDTAIGYFRLDIDGSQFEIDISVSGNKDENLLKPVDRVGIGTLWNGNIDDVIVRDFDPSLPSVVRNTFGYPFGFGSFSR